MRIEHNGETMELNSAAELMEWVNERKRLFPTKQRIEEKKTEVQLRMEERKRIELETRAAAAAADPTSSFAKSLPGQRERPRDKDRDSKQKLRKPKDREPATTQQTRDDQHSAVPLQQSTISAEAQSEAGASNVVKESAVAVPDDELPVATTGVEETTVIEQQGGTNSASSEALQALEAALDLGPDMPEKMVAKQAESAESSSESSSSSSDSDDDAPEEVTSKHDGPVRVPPPNSERQNCGVFAKTGHCRFGARCKYKHVLSEQAQQKRSETGGTKRKSLFQRMVDHEREEENKLVLQAIKYLGGTGFFSKQ